ncbi:hypothetical protein DICPUDRAFT_52650 [Dictyostelium purpureum]|uniref:Uncharacterized protein n=1 Tax=Dictyostelium purpureum TaxID=5786 RepID=F0Z9B0_DICPU|nr:uncharacterized protein DICPUDRAFT_52650 [Dictyostelium purpureum]EGC39469.1 hypothetical protein DICPUDRAFT_52650 [Dictyostelium purpureum]|eukprot:XP_003284027.1 hypothetical protein DICPUDRAFT_52650 [Dictyostelium purpureum]
MSFFKNLPKVEVGDDCEGGTSDEEKDIACSSSPSSDQPQEEQSKKPLIISILTVLISIPALVGASVTFAHAITYAITLAILSNLAQYHYHKCQSRPREKGHWHKYGPFYLTLLAVPLATFDILRHILVDNQLWTVHSFVSPAAYRPGCTHENIRCLSVMGWFSAIIFTYTGYALLLTGTIWCAELHIKIKKLWQQLRPKKK